MELSGTVVKVFEDKKAGSFIERVIRIKSDTKGQVLDVYTYNKVAFKCGFLEVKEKVKFSIVLQGIEAEEKQETKIVASRLLFPAINPTKDHHLVGVEYVRNPIKPGK